MRPRIRQKWRPPLTLVIGGTLAAVLCTPLIAIAYFRVAGGILGWGETSWLIAWMAVISTAILGFLLWRLVLRPVKALTAHARALKEGRGDVPMPEHFGTPEIGALGEAVIDMGATLQNREAGLRAYADHVTHELKSPLITLRGAAELLEGDLADADRARLVASIQEAAGRMTELLDALQDLARAREAGAAGRSDLRAVLAGLAPGIAVEAEGDFAPVPMAGEALAAVLTQLFQNARDHGADRVRITPVADGFEVVDDGRGISEGNRGRVFDPFFTTRREGGGTGLGLSIVRTLLASAGGEIALVPGSGGARFRVIF